MILPIIPYGDIVLRKRGVEIEQSYPKLDQLIQNMFETMYQAHGVGLAAPQIGLSIRLFIIDCTPFEEEDTKLKGFKKVFINPVIETEDGEKWSFNEGCLSIPEIREDVLRKPKIRITYMDEHFKTHTEEYDGMSARVIQHEYDHIEGKLFIDYLSPLKKRMLEKKLRDISYGRVSTEYRMKYTKRK